MRNIAYALMLLACSGSAALRAAPQQAEPPPATQPAAQFFSGVVTSLSHESITVNRRGLGKDSETRTFILDASTAIEGRLRIRAKVTVRFATNENGNRAVHIIVR